MIENISTGRDVPPQNPQGGGFCATLKASDGGRAALDHAHISVRSGGRQLVIDRGNRSQEVDSDPDDRVDDSDQEPSKRGEITGFSADSRRRLRKKLHAVERDAGGLFITLTYHEDHPAPGECKRQLEVFWKRLQRRFPDISSIWKMEPQERGVPHFHLMIFGIDFIPVQWLSKQWNDVVGDTDTHRKSGVELEPFVNQNGKLQGYMAKYMGKEYDTWPGVEEGDEWAEMGRWWGCLNRDQIPYAEWDDARIYLDQGEAIQLISDLLDEWGVTIADGVIPPSLTINTRGDPLDRLDSLMARL